MLYRAPEDFVQPCSFSKIKLFMIDWILSPKGPGGTTMRAAGTGSSTPLLFVDLVRRNVQVDVKR